VSSDIKELVGLTAWIRTAYSTSFGLVVVFCMSRPASGLSVIIPLCVKTGIATVLIVGENMVRIKYTKHILAGASSSVELVDERKIRW
jgi:hypothetical protein